MINSMYGQSRGEREVTLVEYTRDREALAQAVLPKLGFIYIGSVVHSEERVWVRREGPRAEINCPTLDEIPLLPLLIAYLIDRDGEVHIAEDEGGFLKVTRFDENGNGGYLGEGHTIVRALVEAVR